MRTATVTGIIAVLLPVTAVEAQWIDGWLETNTGSSCVITKSLSDDEGKFILHLSNISDRVVLSVFNSSWKEPKSRKLPYIALKSGSKILSDSALSVSSSSYGNGLIFKLQGTPSGIASELQSSPLVVWDARQPRKLFSLTIEQSRAFSNWLDCAAKAQRSSATDPF